MKEDTERDPLTGTQVMSAVATGGGGGIFQARVGALYLANMLTGLPTAFCLHGCRVDTLRFEARYTGAHTDDIYCQISRIGTTWHQFIQCKRGLNATAGDTDFIDSLQGAWRDFLRVEGTPFVRGHDVLVIATIAPATSANQAAKRLCELSRASVDLADFLLKLESKLFDRKHRATWAAFKTVSQATLGDKYTEELVFELLQHLRVDIHDLANDTSQELSLVQALLTSGQPSDSGEAVWDGLFAYVQEHGISVGTVNRQTWPSTAKAGLQEMVSRLSSHRGLGSAAERMSERALMQLSLISAKLPNDAHIPRGDCVARVLASFDERQLAIVTGGPGAGKSAVVSELTPLLRESGPLFFFRADELEAPGLAAVQSLQGLPDPVLSLSAMLCAGRPTVVIDSMEKFLEGSNRGALEELLALVRKNKQARLCVTTRSYALNSLYLNFLSSLPHQVVDVPSLTDAEVAAAVAGSALENALYRDAGVREVLRAPYYLKLAFTYIAAQGTLPPASGNDLRRLLWKERVAPSMSPAGMATRRQAAFDEVCYQRTDRFAQFVDAPSDAEAVAALIQDSVLARDSTDRVAPAHDVLEDWSLIFRVEREVRSAERDWVALFARLGSHAGMRRALRSWTAEKSAVGDEDAYALLEAALRPDLAMPQLWRDEVAIGLLRSERVEELVAKLGSSGAFNNAALLQRLSHLLRVACKGPTALDYSQLADDPAHKEVLARIGMAAPVGKAWDVMTSLVTKTFPSLPPEAHGWVVQLAEDAIAHNAQWWEPSHRVLDVFKLAEHFCWRDNDPWYRERSLGQRFYALLCSTCGADGPRFKAYVDALIERLAKATESRDGYAEERLEYLTNFKHSREASCFQPELVRRAFRALYVETEPQKHRGFGMNGWEADMGLSGRAAHAFWPASVMQGPFRNLLLFSFAKSLVFVIELCNHAAEHFAKNRPDQVSVIEAAWSPNGRPHIHDWRLWAAYRGMSVSSDILASALMSLEERLLIDAKSQPELIKHALEFILDRGTSSFTTSVAASLMTAHPSLVTEKMLGIFKSPWFFVDDFSRCQQDPLALAIHGGHDGLDGERQKERVASKNLPHRRYHLEDLALQLQLSRLDLREAIFAILDQHKAALPANPEDARSWRIALKRMDLRELKVGKQVEGGRAVTLEIANLEPELQQASARAGERLRWMDRLSAIRLWAAAITRPDTVSDPNRADSFSSPTEVFDEFLKVREEFTDDDSAMLIGLQDELPCALIQRWPEDSSPALQWARHYLIATTAQKPDKDTWVQRGPMEGELRFRTLVMLASRSPSLPNMPTALANIVTEPVWQVRRAAANAISDVVRAQQPELAAVLTWGLAHYAESLETMISCPRGRRRDLVDGARDATVKVLLRALAIGKPGEMPVPTSLVAAKEWTIALDAARTESPGTWRVRALAALVRLMADQEGKPRVDPHDPGHVDFEARRDTGDLLACELLAQPSREGPAFELLAYCLKNAPELSERVLESTLMASMKQEYANAEAFWRVWDEAIATVLGDPSLRTRSRRSFSRFDKVLRTLLLCSVPWMNTRYDLPLLQHRPAFIAHCLRAAGDSLPALENLLRLMAGIGRTQAVPAAVPQLRDAIRSAPADLFDDENCLWDAETICRVAVHENRPALMRDVTLRRATLDVLDRLVDAGSSLAFQLRDYLASSATTPSAAID
ncbi:hypothetical protein [Inhella proteolytica]|uniref:Uncharacterized protein n=1 Tax=Inhella proteolytica TaxID=2795029 RepID=A0A931NHU8_9BURK|nr:hypothetical protein [Inhella proteolytica]MBH9578163.1 hypothetical protein [Inhella proteolytica]